LHDEESLREAVFSLTNKNKAYQEVIAEDKINMLLMQKQGEK